MPQAAEAFEYVARRAGNKQPRAAAQDAEQIAATVTCRLQPSAHMPVGYRTVAAPSSSTCKHTPQHQDLLCYFSRCDLCAVHCSECAWNPLRAQRQHPQRSTLPSRYIWPWFEKATGMCAMPARLCDRWSHGTDYSAGMRYALTIQRPGRNAVAGLCAQGGLSAKHVQQCCICMAYRALP